MDIKKYEGVYHYTLLEFYEFSNFFWSRKFQSKERAFELFHFRNSFDNLSNELISSLNDIKPMYWYRNKVQCRKKSLNLLNFSLLYVYKRENYVVLCKQHGFPEILVTLNCTQSLKKPRLSGNWKFVTTLSVEGKKLCIILYFFDRWRTRQVPTRRYRTGASGQKTCNWTTHNAAL